MHTLIINLLIALTQTTYPLSEGTKQSSVNLSSDIIVAKSDAHGLSLQYSFSDDQLSQEKVAADGKEYTIFNIKGATRKEQIGQFDLPSREVVIAIPQLGEISVIAEPGFVTHFENVEIPPVPYKSWEKPPEYKFRQDLKSDLYPENICEIKEISYFRGIRIARLKIFPIQYNRITKQTVVNSDITVTVRFSRLAEDNFTPDYFDGVAKDIILNWEDGVKWKSGPLNLNLNTGFSKYPQGFLNWYKIKIESTGVYKITYDELRRAGIPIGLIDPRTLRLFNIGNCTSNVYYPDTMTEIPIYISGEADSSFDNRDYILFFGVSPSRYNHNHSSFYMNPFTKYNYYWLTWGFSISYSGFGKRIEQITSQLSGNRIYSAENYVRLEKDRDCPARNGLLWIWEFYAKDGNTSSKTFDLPLELVNPESLFFIASRFYARTDTNWIKIGLNSNVLDSFMFFGQSTGPPAYDFVINKRLPLNETNNLTFTLYDQWGHRGQDAFFDFINCRYLEKLELSEGIQDLYFYSKPGNYDLAVRKAGNKPIILDISDYSNPQMFTGYTKNRDTLVFGVAIQETSFYYVSDESKTRSVLSIERKNPGQSLNYPSLHYIIVVPDELYESAMLFENYRRNNIAGIPQAQVIAIPLSQIYDDFTFGIEEPGAIKRLFKKYRPYYGLLLGDGTYDYRNILNLLTFPPCPAYEQGYDIDFQVYSLGALTVDAWYADFDAGGWSPDMALGRVTARTPNEVRRFYDKLVNYENQQSTGIWNKRFILLSDDEWKGQGIPDEFGFQHVENNENLENTLYNSTNNRFSQYEPVKVYLTEYPFSESRDKRKAREALLAELNKGASLWCFFGHGAGFQLCHEQVLHISHVPLVHTGRKNFIGFYGSCGVGRFEDTKYESVSEELVRKEDAGIATIAASKATGPGNYDFAYTLFSRLITQPESTIGSAFLRSLQIDYTYHLFGDPATVPALPTDFGNISIIPDTFNTAQSIRAQVQTTGNDYFAASAYSTKWRREYQSEIGTIFYNLSGYELFRGTGRPIRDTINFNFTVPIGLPRFIRYDVMNGGGGYSELPNSARVSAVAYRAGQNQIYSYTKDSIPFDTLQANASDITGPKIILYNGDKRLKQQDNLPAKFTLTGVLSDSSGIFIAPMVGFNPRLIVKKYPNHNVLDVDLTSYFSYDIGNFYQGRFSYPVELDTGNCVITVKAADNLRNLASESVAVTVQKNQRLALDNVLYYSSPSSRTGYFTFVLSQPASVSIKVYTINGRLIKSISDRPFSFGYNQIVWDGLDEEGVLPSNGVYLYKIQARSYERGNEEKVTVIEKFIILH